MSIDASKHQAARSGSSKSGHPAQSKQAPPQPSRAPLTSILQRATSMPGSLTSADVLQLQSTMGNQAVTQLMSTLRQGKTPAQRKMASGPVAQRVPVHTGIQVDKGEKIDAYELLKLLQDATDKGMGSLAAREEGDWMKEWKGKITKQTGAYDFSMTPTFAYNKAKVDKHFSLGGHKFVSSAGNNYIHPENSLETNDKTTYPELAGALESYDGVTADDNEKSRAERIRGLLKTKMAFGTSADPSYAPPTGAGAQGLYEANTAAALFGAEFVRTDRSFLGNMMLLDRLEAGEKYGRAKDKKLNLHKLLNARKLSGETNHQFGKRKLGGAEVRSPGITSEVYTTVKGSSYLLDAYNNDTYAKEFIPSVHGGKAPWASAGSRAMGEASLPKAGDKLNLLNMREVSNTIKWINMQLGAGEINKLDKKTAIEQIEKLLAERISHYDLMTKKPEPEPVVSSPIASTTEDPKPEVVTSVSSTVESNATSSTEVVTLPTKEELEGVKKLVEAEKKAEDETGE